MTSHRYYIVNPHICCITVPRHFPLACALDGCPENQGSLYFNESQSINQSISKRRVIICSGKHFAYPTILFLTQPQILIKNLIPEYFTNRYYSVVTCDTVCI